MCVEDAGAKAYRSRERETVHPDVAALRARADEAVQQGVGEQELMEAESHVRKETRT